MPDQYQLTVLMAVYNEHRFVRTCIDSMLAQTYSDFRFLIVDDASTDDTPAIVAAKSDAHPGRVVHLRPSGNAPECRCYAEAETAEAAQALVASHLDKLTRALG